jgi:hypothetical protein
VIDTAATVLGAIAWDPEIRNILALLVGIVVLCGSVYLIIATNTGIRTGLLVALAGLFGWIAVMGVIWWIYGIGMQGESPSWKVEEINYSGQDFEALNQATLDEAHRLAALADLPTAQDILRDRPELVDEILPPDLEPDEREAREANISLGQIVEVAPDIVEEYGFDEALGDWELLPVADRQRGDAVATADEFLGPNGRALFEGPSDYLVRDTFSFGGKEGLPENPSRWDRIWTEFRNTILEPFHPTHYAVVQVQPVVPLCDTEEGQQPTAEQPCIEVEPGEATPPPVMDEDAPLVSVIMVRDLGDRRFPAFMVTVIFSALFGLTCWSLHRRDVVIAKVRAATT